VPDGPWCSTGDLTQLPVLVGIEVDLPLPGPSHPVVRPADAAIDQICAAGGTLLTRDELAPGWPTAFLRDPDGYVFQI
jgi:hypothetical protein